MIYLILSVIKWEILTATICTLTDSMLFIGYFSMSFMIRRTSKDIGGNAISLAVFCLSDETLTSPTFEILDFVVKVKLLLSLTITFSNMTELPFCRTFNLLVSYNVHFAIMEELATLKTANFFSSPLAITYVFSPVTPQIFTLTGALYDPCFFGF